MNSPRYELIKKSISDYYAIPSKYFNYQNFSAKVASVCNWASNDILKILSQNHFDHHEYRSYETTIFELINSEYMLDTYKELNWWEWKDLVKRFVSSIKLWKFMDVSRIALEIYLQLNSSDLRWFWMSFIADFSIYINKSTKSIHSNDVFYDNIVFDKSYEKIQSQIQNDSSLIHNIYMIELNINKMILYWTARSKNKQNIALASLQNLLAIILKDWFKNIQLDSKILTIKCETSFKDLFKVLSLWLFNWVKVIS